MSTPNTEKLKPKLRPRSAEIKVSANCERLDDQTKRLLCDGVRSVYREIEPTILTPWDAADIVDDFGLMLERYTTHLYYGPRHYAQFGEHFADAPSHSALNPMQRRRIGDALTALLINLNIMRIHPVDLDEAVFAPVWRVEDYRRRSRICARRVLAAA